MSLFVFTLCFFVCQNCPYTFWGDHVAVVGNCAESLGVMGWSRWRLDDHDVTVVLLEFFWKTDENYGVLDVFILALLDMCFLKMFFYLRPFVKLACSPQNGCQPRRILGSGLGIRREARTCFWAALANQQRLE